MSETLTGARLKFMLNGVKVGYAVGVNIDESIDYQPIEVLDNIEVEEHCPVGYRVNMTAQLIRLFNKSLKQAGYFPKQGSNPQQFLENILKMPELTAALDDSYEKETVFVVEGVKVASQSIAVSARGVVANNATMVAKRCRDESDLSP